MRLGDYELGYNDTPECGIYEGDARELARAVPDESVDLIVADPPYYKIAGAAWDHQWDSIEEWADWCLDWGRECCRALKPNGSAYIYGDEKNLAYLQVRFDGLGWGLLNRIVWSKSNYTALKASDDAMRSYKPQGEEHILFYGKDITFPSFSEVRNPEAAQPMAQYLRSERLRAGATVKEVSALFPSASGGLTGCVSNWELGYNFPLKEQYEAIRAYLNGLNGSEYLREEYEDLREEYEDLREEYEDLRRPFYGGSFTDVWEGPLISAAHKQREAEKPRWINDRILQCSSKSGAVVLDLFTGSGSLLEACIQNGRHYLAFDADRQAVAMARKRVKTAQPPLFVLDLGLPPDAD